MNNKENPTNFISLQEAIEYCDYSQEYLSLRARQGKLKAVKFGRNWMTKKEWIDEYLKGIEEYNNNNQTKYVQPPKNLPIEEKGFIFEIKKPLELKPVLKPVFVFGLAFVLLISVGVFGKTSFKNVYEDIAVFSNQLSITKDQLAAVAAPDVLELTFTTFKEYSRWFSQGLKEMPQGIVKSYIVANQSLEEKIIETGQNFVQGYLVANDFIENGFSNFGTTISEGYSSADQFVENKISGFTTLITKPWKIIPERAVVVKEVEREEFEKLQQELEQLKKEPFIVKEVEKIIEVSKVVEVEPIKEVEKVKEITKVDEEELGKLKTQIAQFSLWESDIEELRGITKKLQSAPTYTPSPSAPIYIASQGLEVGGAGIFNSLGVSGSAGFGNLGVGGSTNLGTDSDDDLTVNATSYFKAPATFGATSANTLIVDNSGNLTTDGTISSSGDLTVGGNATITGILNVVGAASFLSPPTITSTTTPQFTIQYDSSNYLTSSVSSGGAATLAATGAFNITAGGTDQNITLTPSGTGAVIISSDLTSQGQGIFTKAPTLPHAFVAWTTGVANSQVTDAVLYINPATAASDSNLLGLAIADSVKFLVDAEGDVFVNTLTAAGSVTVGATTISNLTVENNTTLGDALTDWIIADATFKSSLVPFTDDTYDLGENTTPLRWQTGYFGTSVVVGASGTMTTDALTFTGALTVSYSGGQIIGTGTDAIILGNVGDTLSLASSDWNISTTGAMTNATYEGLTITTSTGTLTIPAAKTIQFADAFTTSGANALTLTTAGVTNVTLPTTGTLSTLAGIETLTNKTLTSSDINAGTVDDITSLTVANDVDIGAWQLRAETFYSDVATSTAPFTVASTTTVSNLSADLLDGWELTDIQEQIMSSATQPVNSKGNSFSTIQAAINDQASNGWVYVPPGTYTEAVDINNNDNLMLFGAGWGMTKITYAGNDHTLYIVNSDDVIIRDIRIDQTSTGNTVNAITINGAQRCKIQNVYVGDSDDFGIVFEGTDSAYCEIVSCYITDTGDVGIYDNTAASHLTIRDSVIVNAGVSRSNCILSYSDYLTIDNCYIAGSTKHGIEFKGEYAKVVNSTIRDHDEHGIYINDSDHSIISNNSSFNNGDDTLGNYYGIYVFSSSYCSILGNNSYTTNNKQKHGIYAYNSHHNIINNNYCRGNVSDGINITGDIAPYADYNTVIGNICIDNGGKGIYIFGDKGSGNDYVNKTIVADNQLYDNTGTNLDDDGTDTQISGNYTGTAGEGLFHIGGNSSRSTLTVTQSSTGNIVDLTGDSITTGTGLSMSLDTLAAGKGIAVDSTSTAFAGKLLELTASGAVDTTRYGLYSALSGAGGGTSTNIAGYFSSQNATNNYGLIVEHGSVGIGTTGPDRKLDVLDASSPQLRITQADNSVYVDFQVAASTGNLTISTIPTDSDIIIYDNNLLVCADGACPSVTGRVDAGDLIVENEAYFSGDKLFYPSDAGFTRPKRTIILTAAGAITPTSNGAAQTKVDGTNFVYYTLDFDQTADENAYWEFVVPDSFDSSTNCNVYIFWTASAGTVSHGVSWKITTLGRADDEELDVVLANELEIEDALIATDDIMVSDTGSLNDDWSPGEFAVIRIYRDVDDYGGVSNLAADAKLLQVKLEYSVTQESD
ncbi:right-handed parallel beta-helix repeat-containing protein [Patescibacteria group bacterium]